MCGDVKGEGEKTCSGSLKLAGCLLRWRPSCSEDGPAVAVCKLPPLAVSAQQLLMWGDPVEVRVCPDLQPARLTASHQAAGALPGVGQVRVGLFVSPSFPLCLE